MSSRYIYKSLVVASFAVMVFFASAVQAKGLFIVNTGDEVFDVSDAPLIKAAMGDGWKLGYTCAHFGLLWADVWRWDCKMAAVNSEQFSYAELPPDIQKEYESKYTLSDAKRGMWNHYGIWLLAGVLVIGGLMKTKKS